jgi:hypothetical protein
VDIFPREGKYKHAAVFSYRNGSTRLDRCPQAALVANLDRKGLTLDELETLLHELGHSLHNKPVGHAALGAGRHPCAARFRRSAVADAGGLGLRQARARAVRAGLLVVARRCPTT